MGTLLKEELWISKHGLENAVQRARKEHPVHSPQHILDRTNTREPSEHPSSRSPPYNEILIRGIDSQGNRVEIIGIFVIKGSITEQGRKKMKDLSEMLGLPMIELEETKPYFEP